MALFAHRPQFNDELPGLPGEPLRPESAAERLGDAAPVDAAGVSLLGEGAVESIAIPIVPQIEAAQSPESGRNEDDPPAA